MGRTTPISRVDITPEVLVKLLANVTVTGPNPEDCWLWRGATNSDGYGLLRIGSEVRYAHRLFYMLNNGEFPEGKTTGHQCHNRAVANGQCSGGPQDPHRRCVRPSHLGAEDPLQQAASTYRKNRVTV